MASDLNIVITISARDAGRDSYAVQLLYEGKPLADVWAQIDRQALQHYEQALPLSRQVGDKRGQAVTLNNIGRVYDDLGDKAQALHYFEQALPLLRQVGDRWAESVTCFNIGMIYAGLGDLAQAESLLMRTVELDQAIGHPELESDRATLEAVRNRLQAREE
jgi:tetratricopeptide (TPR) repeat protein